MTECDSSLQGEIRVSRDVMPATQADRDRGVDRFEGEEHACDRSRCREVRPLPLRASLLDVERRRREVRTVVRRLERHVVGQPLRLLPQSPQGRSHPPRRGRHERFRLPSEFGGTRIADRVDSQTRPATLRAMLRQIDDEVDGPSERPFEVPIQMVAIQVVLGNRHEDHVPPPPGCPSTERNVRLPGGQRQERVPLVAARLVRLRGHEAPHGRGKGLRGQGLSSDASRTIFMCVAPVRRREAMVTVTFLSSVQGYQEDRVEEIVKRLRGDHPEWKVDILSPEASKPVLANYKLQFGPAILVNERIEFVGVPRYRNARRADCDGGGGPHPPAPRAASAPRAADRGGGRKPARAGETAGGRGDKTVPVIRLASSEPRLPMENPVLAKTI